MENLDFVRKIIEVARPSIQFQYELLEEARLLAEIDREQKRITKTNKRKLENKEIQNIKAELDAEKRREFSAKARRQQLEQETDELKQLNHYLATARNTKTLVAQLKTEDVEIDRRYEIVKRDAQAIKDRFRVIDEHEAKAEEELRRRGKEHLFDLQAQLKVNAARRLDDRTEYVRMGQELRERMKEDDKKFQKELEAAEIVKMKIKEETLEYLRERMEAKKLEKQDEKRFIRELIKMQERDDAIAKGILDARNERIRRQQEIGQNIGAKVLAINTAKERKIENIIDGFAVDLKYRTDLLYEKEEEKAQELRQLMKRNMGIQMAERQMKKERQIMRTNEDMVKRLLQPSHHISEMNLLRKRMQREQRDIENYLVMKTLEIEERKAEQNLLSKFGTPQETETRVQQEIKAVRAQILEEQPISVLRYLPTSVLRSDYLPEPLGEQVRKQVLRDPIPVFNIKRHQRHINRIKDEGGDRVVCCKACPPPKLLSNIF